MHERTRRTLAAQRRYMCSKDGQEAKVRINVQWQRGKLASERRRETKRGKERAGNPKMVPRSNYDMPGHRRNAGAHVHTRSKTPCEGLH